MSQKASRKSAVNEEKEKSSDTPVKEMKKKMAANADKEKQAAEKATEKPAEKSDKTSEKSEKSAEKSEKHDKSAENLDKGSEKNEKTDKRTEKKHDKQAEKKAEAPAEKKTDAPVEKKTEAAVEKKEEKDSSKEENGKPEKPASKPKQNGKPTNGAHDENGTVSPYDEDSDDLVIDDRDGDEMFPELTYDDTSDPEFEPAHARSYTRRSQAKAARTPETPRPASGKQAEADDQSKVLKLKEDVPSTDRKLRSSDSPKPQESKKSQEKTQESAKKQESAKSQESKEGKQESETKDQDEKENGEKSEKVVDVVIEIEADEEPRKTDTNYSKSRVKVSPYRRSVRQADQTTSSVMANYTGNNTTMEMDISETSSFVSHDDPSLDDSSYLSGLRSIRGRRSYKPLKEMTLRHVVANRSAAKAQTTPASDHPSRPTGTVVGRKRKPEADDSVELASEASEVLTAAHSKRMRLLDRLTHSFRRTASSTPLPARRAAEIVGINTDLPLTAPVASPETFDPESLKPTAVSPDVTLAPPPPAVSLARADAERDGKRCVVM